MMEVILLERIEKLGQMGDVVSVKPGYARNYLLPQNKALWATDENRARFETERAQLEATNLERRSEAEKVAEKAANLSVVLIRQAGESSQLYGSVSARDIADAVTEAGVSIRRQQVWLSMPIKSLGLHDVAISLHPEVTVEVAVNVARTLAEAETQARTGRAVLGVGIEEDPEVTIEEQAAEVFEAEVAEQAIEQVHAEEAFDEEVSEAETADSTEPTDGEDAPESNETTKEAT